MTETMRPEDVPNDLADLAVTAWFGINDKAWGLEGLHRVMRICLAAALPEHERMVIDRIACQPPGSVVVSDAEYAALKAERAEVEKEIREQAAAEVLADMASRPSDSMYARGSADTARRIARRLNGEICLAHDCGCRVPCSCVSDLAHPKEETR